MVIVEHATFLPPFAIAPAYLPTSGEARTICKELLTVLEFNKGPTAADKDGL